MRNVISRDTCLQTKCLTITRPGFSLLIRIGPAISFKGNVVKGHATLKIRSLDITLAVPSKWVSDIIIRARGFSSCCIPAVNALRRFIFFLDYTFQRKIVSHKVSIHLMLLQNALPHFCKPQKGLGGI